MTENKNFVNGLFVKTQETKYWEILKLSFKVDDFIKYLEENKNNAWYVNIDILESKAWNKYAKLNTYQAKQENKQEEQEEDLPF